MIQSLRESFGFAVRGVTANKMRSALTTLGILIGVASVIILVAVGNGSAQSVTDQLSSLGSNTLTVTSSSGGGGGMGGGPGGSVTGGTSTSIAQLTEDDAEALVDADLAPDILRVAPVASVSSVTATYESASYDVSSFIGSTPEYLDINTDTVQSGEVFTDDDQENSKRVALLGSTVAENLIGDDTSELVGETIQLNGSSFQVIGILTDKGSSGMSDSDDRIIAPLSATQDTLFGYGSLSSISVQSTSADTVDLAESEIASILNGRHHVTSDDADYTISSSTSILSAVTSTSSTFTVLLAAVASISLLVGGIGVMNIMLVTVTERTREIGIRKAIGAQKIDIVSQFLFEAVLLSLFGGVMGILVGVVGSQFEIVGIQPVVSMGSVLGAFGVSLGTGLFFGLYPANQASKLRPIDALRYE